MTKDTKENRQKFRAEYLEALREGDSLKASQVVDRALENGWTISQIYTQLFTPIQRKIGDLWEASEINVAEEHLATQITYSLMEKLKQSFRPRKRINYKIAVVTSPSAQHSLGARMVSDIFTLEGWRVYYLGNTPPEDLTQFIEDKKIDLVAISVTLSEDLENIKEIIEGIQSLESSPKIMLGGAAAKKAGDLDIHILAKDLEEGLEKTYKLFGLGHTNSLEDYLNTVGKKIQSLRKKRRWSQKELASKTELDRTYISAMEHGKQNITLGVLLKIATAFEIPLEELFHYKNGRH